jgi:hypothetical protein
MGKVQDEGCMIEQYCNSTTRTILLWMKLRLLTLCNIYKGQKKYPWSGVILVLGKDKVREIN